MNARMAGWLCLLLVLVGCSTPSGSADRVVDLRIVSTHDVGAPLVALAWDPRRSRFLGLDGEGVLYDLEDPDAIRAVATGLGSPRSMIVGADGVLRLVESDSRSVVSWEPGSGRRRVVAGAFDGARFHMPADVAFDADGALWLTDKGDGMSLLSDLEGPPPNSGLGGLYRIERSGEVVRIADEDLKAPDAVAVSPGGDRVYVVDWSGSAGRLIAFRRDRNGRLRDPSVLPGVDRCGPIEVLGDGPGPWASGTLLIGSHGGLQFLGPAGERLGRAEWPIPVDHHLASVTGMALGGPDGRSLAIATTTRFSESSRVVFVRLTDRD